jgi:beta-lactamase class A
MKPASFSRRRFLSATTAMLASASAPAVSRGRARDDAATLAGIEARAGGRVGVFALDTGTHREIAHRPDERFAMCSTFKWVLTAAVFARVDRGELSLEERLRFGPADLLVNAPVTSSHVAEGGLSVGVLAEASVKVSDNTAANLLLAKLGGPSGFTAFVRSAGDNVTRLDRNEIELNDNDPGDPRDTTTPRAMVGLMRQILCGDVLQPASRSLLLRWMRECETGRRRLRAGLPADWSVGDKTGSSKRGAVNDVAIASPPGRAPILIASYLSDSNAETARLEAAHADIGRLVGRQFASASLR